MVCIVYSLKDEVSASAAEALKESMQFKETKPVSGMRHFDADGTEMLEIKDLHLNADYLDGKIETDCIIFLSRHSSAKEVPAFTVHPEGNWTSEAKLGGKPKELAFAAPVQMLQILTSMQNMNTSNVQVTYEATHHGPLLKTPSLYAEIGGNEQIRANIEYIKFLAAAVQNSIYNEVGYDKIALGIGGLHYADRFAKRALEGKYAFAHIMPRHTVDNVDMIGQALSRSVPKTEVAVIDWKSISDPQRQAVIKKLEEFGIDYYKI